jgi:hypothetical protein
MVDAGLWVWFRVACGRSNFEKHVRVRTGWNGTKFQICPGSLVGLERYSVGAVNS